MSDQVRPFKVWNCDRSIKKSVTASSLRDVIEKGRTKLGLTQVSRVILENDGTEVDDEDYFSFIPSHSTLLLLTEGECWQPAGKEDVDHVDHGTSSSEEKNQTAALAQELKIDLSRIITFSSNQLQQLVDEDTSCLARHLRESERFAASLQEACQRHLDERAQASDTVGLLKLYHKAHQASSRAGTKRKAPADEG